MIIVDLSSMSTGTKTGSVAVDDMGRRSVAISLAANVVMPGAMRIEPATKDFGNIDLNATSASVRFSVLNEGMTTTGPLNVTLGGSNPFEFRLNDGCSGMALMAAESCSLTVILQPTAAGPKTASVVVSANPGGTGAASLVGHGLGPAALSVMPSIFAFPITQVGGPLATHQFVITNSGDVASPVLTVDVSAAPSTVEFAIATDMCSGKPLSACASCTFNVDFAPASFGSKVATLRVNGGPPSVSATGTGQDSVTLSVLKGGSGAGTVSGTGLDCGPTCTEQVLRSLVVPTISLVATPDATSTFSGWSGGGCSGTNPCSVVMSQAQAVSATFTRMRVPLTVRFRALGQAGANISSNPPGVTCAGTNCSQTATFDAGTRVTLAVSGLAATAMGAWSPTDCIGASCVVVLDSARTVSFVSTVNNIVFTTSTQYSGNFGGVAQADAACNAVASVAGIPGRFVAFLGISSGSPFDRLTGRGWVRLDGLAVADTVASMQTDAHLWYPIGMNELGQTYSRFVRTGDDSSSCPDWTSDSDSLLSLGGFASGGARGWRNGIGEACSQPEPIYCFGTNFNRPLSLTTDNGLSVGRIAFITRLAFTGNFGGAIGGDQECQREAAAAGLANPSTFRALIATTTASAASRFDLMKARWVRPDGVAVSATPTNFMNRTLTAPIALLADGTSISNDTDGNASLTWLGAAMFPLASGTVAETCNDWSSSASTALGTSQSPGWGNEASFSGVPVPCDATGALICLEN